MGTSCSMMLFSRSTASCRSAAMSCSTSYRRSIRVTWQRCRNHTTHTKSHQITPNYTKSHQITGANHEGITELNQACVAHAFICTALRSSAEHVLSHISGCRACLITNVSTAPYALGKSHTCSEHTRMAGPSAWKASSSAMHCCSRSTSTALFHESTSAQRTFLYSCDLERSPSRVRVRLGLVLIDVAVIDSRHWICREVARKRRLVICAET